jgi:hypothetical protein
MSTNDLAAVRAEALQKPAEVTFRDAKFTIEPPDGWLFDFAHYADRQQITRCLETALGAVQYEQFRTMTPRPTMTEVAQLIEQITSRFNIDQGE